MWKRSLLIHLPTGMLLKDKRIAQMMTVKVSWYTYLNSCYCKPSVYYYSQKVLHPKKWKLRSRTLPLLPPQLPLCNAHPPTNHRPIVFPLWCQKWSHHHLNCPIKFLKTLQVLAIPKQHQLVTTYQPLHQEHNHHPVWTRTLRLALVPHCSFCMYILYTYTFV